MAHLKLARRLQLRAAVAVTTVLVFAASLGFCAEEPHQLNYLAPGELNPVILLAPPPLPDSAEERADLNEVRAVYSAASSNDVAAARAEKAFSVFSFSHLVGPFFSSNNLPKTASLFEKVLSDAKLTTDRGKEQFRRPRPYTTDPSLANGKLETTFSYPSGHSTESMVLALVLADLFPEKQEALLAQARLIGWHRVQTARHYPTDIYAGRVLAQQIVRELRKRESFRKDFALAKKEIASIQTAARN